jgi:iron(III) transport system substrate-binding protein
MGLRRNLFSQFISVVIILLAANLFCSCQAKSPAQEVVVYVSVDQVHSEPILKEFEAHTGIKVKAVYDVEATKTTGMVQRLLAEKPHPQADVFWNGEFAQTLYLKEQGVLVPYRSPQAQDLPRDYLDPEGCWAAFGGRARVFIVNTQLLDSSHYPQSIFDLLSPRYPGETIGICNPLFGTMATHAAALYAVLGPERARDFFRQLKQRQVRVVDGNSVVKNLVAQGRLKLGLVDTDDYIEAVQSGAPVKCVFPDQRPEELGTLIIPMTVALIARGPHPEIGKALIDYLLSKEVEVQLVKSGYVNVSRRLPQPHPALQLQEPIKEMPATLVDICRQLPQAQKDLREIFLR